MVLEALKSILIVSDIVISGQAHNGNILKQELLERQTEADVLLLDLNMPDLEPISFMQSLRVTRPEIRVLLVTGAPDARTIDTLMRHGLMGCVLKTTTSDLLEPIRAVAQGNYFISPEAQKLLFEFQQLSVRLEATVDLSERELQLLLRLAHGDTNEEIAQFLNVGRATANNYISRLYGTLGLSNRSQVVNWGLKQGILSVKEGNISLTK